MTLQQSEMRSSAAWLSKFGHKLPDFDSPSFERMAESLLNALTMAGGRDRRVEMLVALLKTSAMVHASMLQDETAGTVEQTCGHWGEALAEQTLRFRHEIGRDLKRRRRRG